MVAEYSILIIGMVGMVGMVVTAFVLGFAIATVRALNREQKLLNEKIQLEWKILKLQMNILDGEEWKDN